MRGLPLLLLLGMTGLHAYSVDDPQAAHTDKAIEYDRAGEMELALLSFRAAARLEETRPLGERLANLGVCLMRMRRFDESIDAMVRAARVYPTEDTATQDHIQSNWDNLMAHLDFHEIPRPAWPTSAEGATASPGSQPVAEDADGWSIDAEDEPPSDVDEDGWSIDDYAESGVDAPPPPPLSPEAAKALAQIEAIYREHNPDKLGDIPELLAKYDGKEARLLRKIRKKYKVQDPSRPRQLYKLHIPRVTAEELAANSTLMSGHWPYVLTGEADKWPAMEKWKDLNYLLRKIPDEWVDFYPRNMYQLGSKPYVQPYSEALPKFRQQTGQSKYMQMRLSLQGWETLLPDLKALPPEFWTEAEWIDDCMSHENGTRDHNAIDNFFRVNQWNFLLIGEKGTGIFFHKDHLAAASWQAAVVGRKRWILCPYDQNYLLSEELFTLKPDYNTPAGKKFAQAFCGDVTVEPGEIIYYPSYWWHQTQCLDTPTVGMTGLMVGVEEDRKDLRFKKVHEQFKFDLEHKCKKCWKMDGSGSTERSCDDISLKWPGAAPPPSYDWCHNYLERCFDLWDGKTSRDAKMAAARSQQKTEL